MLKDDITFTTRVIPEKGEFPRLPAQIITARPLEKSGGEDGWWGLSLITIDGIININIAPAKGCDIKWMLKSVSESILSQSRWDKDGITALLGL